MPNDLFDAPATVDPSANAPVSGQQSAPATQTQPTSTSVPATEVKVAPTSGDDNKTPASSTPATGEMTDEQISRISDAFFSKLTKATEPKSTQKSDEFVITPELAESLKPVRVTQQMLSGLGFEGATPEQVQAFQLFADAIVTHAAHVSSFMQQRALQQAEQRYEPFVGYIQQQQAEAHRNSFYSENKDLQKYEKFVTFAASRVTATKPDGSQKTAKEVSVEVAKATRELLKEAGINLDSQNSANQDTPSTKTVPKMPTLDAGGGSMSGSNQGKNTKPSIFDDL